jgi:hypothetical protein
MKYVKSAFLVVLMLVFRQQTDGQNPEIPLLERTITLQVSDMTLVNVLSELARQTGVVFSYNPETVKTGMVLSADYNGKPMRLVLSGLLGPHVSFKCRGKYIILKSRAESPSGNVNTIEGYVSDSNTGKQLINASVYDKELLTSAITNEYGFFVLKIPSGTSITSLRVSKSGYSDTLLLSESFGSRVQDISVVSKKGEILQQSKLLSLFRLPRLTPTWLLSRKTIINSVNISQKVMGAVQVSLFPPVSTNHFLSGNVKNKFSINSTVGYVYGVDIAEFGGLLNIDLSNVKYFQVAGLGNIVGQNVTGFQGAGIFNYAASVRGVQAGGIINISADTVICQIAGIINNAGCSLIQVSGIVNKSEASGYQLSGIINSAEKSQLQISGLLNYSGKADIQISGLLNRTDSLKRLQVGLVNIANNSKGLSIGIFSFVRNGYHRLEISTDELLSATISFCSGTRLFHTFTGAGFLSVKQNIGSLNYGIGTTLGKESKPGFDIELHERILLDLKKTDFAGSLYSLYVGVNHRLSEKTLLSFGLTYNVLGIDNKSLKTNPGYTSLAPYYLDSDSNGNFKTWIGSRITIKFF